MTAVALLQSIAALCAALTLWLVVDGRRRKAEADDLELAERLLRELLDEINAGIDEGPSPR
ncbi:MAG: hypothetical protein CMM84_16230 [Rhodothermaceae bacterium]|nr:hypothetical protein [Rhodothermaceae bacterium]MBC12507.1 hypothetical protein [Rhodothermaceae bacterium]